MNKFLYFRTVADEANDGVTGLKTNNPSSFMFNADNLTAMQPISDTVLVLYFKPALAHTSDYGMQGLRDTVSLTVDQGDTFEVMQAITDAIANPTRGHSDGFIVVADDVVTTDAPASGPGSEVAANTTITGTYIHSSVTACGTITVQSPSAGIGVHEHYEVIDIPGDAVADDDVIASAGIYIPAQAVLVEAMIINVALSSAGAASCALEVHNAAIADNAASGGTEIIGAGVSGTHSLPNTDLNFGSGDVSGESITGGTLISHESPYDRGTAVSYFHLCAKETSMTPAGAAKVGLYLKWYGPAAVMTAERLA